jgi:hypothetical protein
MLPSDHSVGPSRLNDEAGPDLEVHWHRDGHPRGPRLAPCIAVLSSVVLSGLVACSSAQPFVAPPRSPAVFTAPARVQFGQNLALSFREAREADGRLSVSIILENTGSLGLIIDLRQWSLKTPDQRFLPLSSEAVGNMPLLSLAAGQEHSLTLSFELPWRVDPPDGNFGLVVAGVRFAQGGPAPATGALPITRIGETL